MRQQFVTAVLLGISVMAYAQENPLEPRVSDVPLTVEQIAVYRAVLRDYLKGSDGALNLQNITDPMNESDSACFRGIDARVIKQSKFVIHRIDPAFVTGTKIVLVDPNFQEKAIKENDPQNLIKKAIDGGQKVTDEQLDQSVKKAFSTALFSLSEIVFDKEHRRAVVSYGMVCGELCGHGNTLVLKKVGQRWKLVKRCGGWVS